MAGRKSDFTLPTLDELFTTQELRDDAKLSKIRDIPLELIDDFPGHPFKVRDDEDKYDVPLWHRPILSVAEATEYFGIGSNKIYELTEKENCPFVIWIGSRRVIKRTAFERFLEKQYSI